MRREPWSPYFSKASISRIQPLLIQNTVKKLCDRLEERWVAGETVVMTHAYASLAADFISEYLYPEGYGILNWRPDFTFDDEFYESWVTSSKALPIMKQFRSLFPIIDCMPPWLTLLISPAEICTFVQNEQAVLRQTESVVQRF